MAGPIDAVLAFHNAFRTDMNTIDDAALDLARGKTGAESRLDRARFLNEMLVWHADGEEQAVFPALERLAPMLAEPYVADHRGLDTLAETLSRAIAERNALAVARAAAAYKFHLGIHLHKEDAQVYPLLRQRLNESKQAKIVGAVAGAVPRTRFAEAVAWLFPLLSDTDRENTTRVMQTVQPPPVFAQTLQLIRNAVGDGWAELARRIPSLG
jgi:hemerythrin-like domain-containing protein